MAYPASIFERKGKYHFERMCTGITNLNSLRLDDTTSVDLEDLGYYDGPSALVKSSGEPPIKGIGHYRLINDKLAIGFIMPEDKDKGFKVGDASITGPDYIRKASTARELVGVSLDPDTLKKVKEFGFYDGPYAVKDTSKRNGERVIYQSNRGIFIHLPRCQITLVFAEKAAASSCQEVFDALGLGQCTTK